MNMPECRRDPSGRPLPCVLLRALPSAGRLPAARGPAGQMQRPPRVGRPGGVPLAPEVHAFSSGTVGRRAPRQPVESRGEVLRDQTTPFPLGAHTRTGFSKVETLVWFCFRLQMTVLNHPWRQNLRSVQEAFWSRRRVRGRNASTEPA